MPVPVASANTDGKGGFRLRFTPPVTGSYALATPSITKLEDATLSPVFGDLLSPAQTAAQKLTVHAAVTSLRVSAAAGAAIVFGSVAPGTGHVRGTVTVSARHAGHGAYRRVATVRLASGDGNFAVAVTRAAGRWQFRVAYADPRQVVGTTSRAVTATVAGPAARVVQWRSYRLHGSHLTLTGLLSGRGAASVALVALRTAGSGPRLATRRLTARSATAPTRSGPRCGAVAGTRCSCAPGPASPRCAPWR